jgi:hypothetical protein
LWDSLQSRRGAEACSSSVSSNSNSNSRRDFTTIETKAREGREGTDCVSGVEVGASVNQNEGHLFVSEETSVVESCLVCLREVRKMARKRGREDFILIGVEVGSSVQQQRDGFGEATIGSMVETGPNLRQDIE